MRSDHSDSFPLQGLARLVLDREGHGDWSVSTDDFWCRLQPADYPWPTQGWKLHVSATPLSAPIVLDRAVPVLLRHGCAFKFAASLDEVDSLVATHCPRGNGGKFITAYPCDAERFPLLAEELHLATQGLPGPAILSDRQYEPGSLVHYRYGAFAAESVLSNEGSYDSMLLGPDGERVKDQRNAWFSPPPWATSSLPGAAHQAAAPTRPSAVLLADRFLVREAIQHANKGGVFRAVDQHSDNEVVIKQARAHVGSGIDGRDARDALRNEADILDLLEPLGMTPRKITLFEQQDSLFLVEEAISGLSLRHRVNQHPERRSSAWISAMARQLVEIVAAVHERGLLLRDLTPNNVMVTEHDELRLIDLEHVCRPGTIVRRVLTLAYASPEQATAPPLGPAPELTSDLYALGATLFFLVTGTDPVLPEDVPATRPQRERLSTLLARIGAHQADVRRFTPLILGLTHDEPSLRWDFDQVRDYLEHIGVQGDPGRLASTVDSDRLVADGIAHIIATMNVDNPARPWPSGGFGVTTDPCSVQHGAAGVLHVLTKAAGPLGDERVVDAVRGVSDWICRKLPDEPRLLPGLYFGRSGTAWALYDAARLLEDGPLADRALELARRIPVNWPNPDVCHGLAGAGMAQLHLWQASGESEFGDRVRHCADQLSAMAILDDNGAFWPIPTDFSPDLGGTHYGFAHGVAGVGAFLLAAGLATGNQKYLTLARSAGQALADAAIPVRDEVRWPGHRGSTEPTRLPLSWCSGVAGIGTFLIRLWRATGESRYRTLAVRAARTVLTGSWQQSTVVCHGLAGSGEFLLDLAEELVEPEFRQGAEDILARIVARNAHRHGRMVVADESMHQVTVDYSTGLSGVVGFALRLRHGGPRCWTPQFLVAGAEEGAA